jgi:hypothetical protein
MAEGGMLIEAGLLRPVFDENFVAGVEATDALAVYFDHLPAMERLYPLLVEFVACCRYPELDDRMARRALLALGMPEEGTEALRRAAIGDRPWWAC